MRARTRTAVPTSITADARLGGFVKFAWIPFGGSPAGVVSRTARGRLSISCALKPPVDMFTVVELLEQEKAGVEVGGHLSA